MHEEEELQHNIFKLQDQVHQISLSQRANKDEIRGDMGGLKEELKVTMDILKASMEGLKESLKNLSQERLQGGEKVIHENHDEEKRNMNYDFIDSNVGFKNHQFPKIYISDFYVKDLVTWIL